MVCAGRITSTHGVRGCVRFRSHMLPRFQFLRVEVLIGGLLYTVSGVFIRKFPMLVLTLSCVDTPLKAQALVGLDVFVSKSLLPPLLEGQYYCEDIVGLVVYSSGRYVGSVSMVHDFGAAAEVLEILLLSGKKVMLPFTKECILDIDLVQKRIEVAFPPEI